MGDLQDTMSKTSLANSNPKNATTMHPDGILHLATNKPHNLTSSIYNKYKEKNIPYITRKTYNTNHNGKLTIRFNKFGHEDFNFPPISAPPH